MFGMLKSTSTILLSFHHHMKPTPSSQHSTVTSLLTEGYSVCQIQSKTGLGKSTVGRIKKEVDSDKENSKGGHPSKLSPHDKQSIIQQITTGKLDNAVQATHFINNIISSPVTPQTVRNALKDNNLCSIVKQKHPLLKKGH
jgi:transposase